MKKLLLVLPFLVLVTYSNAQMILSADATSQSCDCYTLTTANDNLSGGIFSPNTIDLSLPFDFSFEVYLGDTDNWSADGIAFILQQGQITVDNNPTSFGALGLVPSFGFEIDVHPNTVAPYNDPAADHVAIFLNGDITTPVSPVITIPNIEDAAFHTLNVIWNPTTQIFQINIDGNLVNVYNGDIINTVFAGNPNVFFGFTGATGGLNNLQQVCMYREALFIQDKLTACVGESISFTDNSTSDLNNITTYLWDFGDGTTSNIQNPTHDWNAVGIENVSLTITDISGCTDVFDVDVTITSGLNIDVVSQDVSCNGLNDGALLATPLDGAAPYTYNWDLTTNVQNPTGLVPNTYTLSLTDNLGCTGTAQGVIVEPTALSITSILFTNATCGVNNGTLTVNASGGSTNYQYSIDGGATFQNANIFTNLAAANYAIQVQDLNALPTICVVNATETIGLASLFSLNPAVVSNVSCGVGVNDGEISVSINNGAANFTYDLSGPINQNQVTALQNHTFSNLIAGLYTVTVTDNSTCSISEANIVVESSTLMVIDYTVSNAATINADCNGATNGELTISTTGAVAVEYSIDNGVTFQTNPNFSNLGANTYNVQVKDNIGCIILGNLVVTEPTPLNILSILIDSNVSCTGFSDAGVTINASGGNGLYSYSLDGGVPTLNNVITGLNASNYTVTLMEGATCMATLNGNFTITEPDVITLTLADLTLNDVSCNGAADGGVVVNSTIGGTPAYAYSMDGTTFVNTPAFNLGFGNHTVFVSDANNCPAATQQFNISESAPIVISLGAVDTTVCFGSVAEVCANVTGGNGVYSYNWNGIQIPNSCLPIITTTTGQTQYSVIVTDGNGCISNNNNPITKTVNVMGGLSVLTNTPPNICEGDAVSLTAEANGSGNGGPYTYTWTNNIDPTDVLIGANQTVYPTQTTAYTVLVSDGCTLPDAFDIVNVIINYNPPLSISPNVPTSDCPPLELDFLSNVDQTLINSQTWNFGNGNISSDSLSTQVYVEVGNYDVSYSFTTAFGCVVEGLFTDYITVYPTPNANFSFSPDDPDMLHLEVNFSNESTGATMHNWDFGTGVSSSIASPIYTFPEYGAVDWSVELKVINGFGCEDSITKVVHIEELQIYYIPNTFSPDDNGTNETFAPVFMPGFTPKDYTFTIFDRWGDLVFKTTDIYSDWNGISNGGKVIDGTYVWQISFLENETDKRYLKMGHVNVIK